MQPRTGDEPASGELRLVLPSRVELIAPAVDFLVAAAARHTALGVHRERRLAVALTEALTNAVIHGNLEVPSALKERDDGAFAQAVADRALHPIYGSRKVEVHLAMAGRRCRWAVADEGPGFDAAAALARDAGDPANVGRASGRGLPLMQAFVDELRYEDGGRRAVLVVYGAPLATAG